MSWIVLGLVTGLDNAMVGSAIGPLRLGRQRRLALALSFGAFEMLMPMLGWWVGAPQWQWLAPTALAICGFLVFFGAQRSDRTVFDSPFTVLLLPLSLSFDNLAAGVGIAGLGVEMVSVALCVGGIAAGMSFLGMTLGERLGASFSARPRAISSALLALCGVASLTLG